MTREEAERAVGEMIDAVWVDDPKKFSYDDYKHKRKLKQALEFSDTEELIKILDEENKDSKLKVNINKEG